ncbi:hypothetical protein ACFJGW_05275 [Burkholderiaceae bacterium UC74_6]
MSSTRSSDPIVVSAARWFWWIAGLSLVNTVMFHAGSQINFVLGLGLTTLAEAKFASQQAVGLAVSGAAIAFYVLIGLQAQREKLWAFIIGGAVYALDALIFVAYEDWTPVVFHAVALFFITKGVIQLRERTSAEQPANA